MFEVFLKIIAMTVLKKAMAGMGLKGLGTAFGLVTLFDALASVTDCDDLGVSGVEVAYHLLTDTARDHLVSEVVKDRYRIERRATGLYAVRSRLHTTPVYVGHPNQYPAFAALLRRIPVQRIPTRTIGG